MTLKSTSIILAAIIAATSAAALANPARQAILDGYASQAGGKASAERGKAFFFATHAGGKPDTTACTACHGNDPRAAGRTRAGKPIDPMAVSAAPSRFTDAAKVEKWFARNCDSVLGRACTAGEKADVIAYLSGL